MTIDDAVDAIPVHFANGIWAVLAVGLFSDPELQSMTYGNTTHVGWFYDFSDPQLLAIQAIELGFILGWVIVTMTPFFIFLRCVGLFRVDPLEEEVGLDISHHRGPGYNLEPANPAAAETLNSSRHKSTSYSLPPPPPPAASNVYEAPAPAPASVGAYSGYSSADESA